MTLRWRLSLLYLGAAAAVLGGLAGVAAFAYRRGSSQAADRALMRACEEATEALEDIRGSAERFLLPLDKFSENHPELFVVARSSVGAILYQSDPNISALLPPAPAPAADGRILLRTLARPQGASLRLASFSPASSGLWLEVGAALPPPARLLSGFPVYLALSLFLLALFGLGAVGWLVAGRALAAVDRIARTAKKVSQGSLSERIAASGEGDELSRLIDVLNEMLERIESSTANLEQFAFNVSHQLRTPLTILRGEIEVALGGPCGDPESVKVLESNLEELVKMSGIVEDLLAYARADAGRSLPASEQRVDQLVSNIAKKVDILARHKGQSLELDIQPTSALVQTVRLEQALLNILDNAIKNTPAGGCVTLRVRPRKGGAEIDVEDTGPGVKPKNLSRLFERGQSGSGSSGIGLSLARSLVGSFGGRIEAFSPEGRGFCVRLLLPAPQAN